MMTASELTLHSTLKRCVDNMSKENAHLRGELHRSRECVASLKGEISTLRAENEELKVGGIHEGNADNEHIMLDTIRNLTSIVNDLMIENKELKGVAP